MDLAQPGGGGLVNYVLQHGLKTPTATTVTGCALVQQKWLWELPGS